MYFEAILPVTDYEISSYKHIMEKSRVVVEKKIRATTSKDRYKKAYKSNQNSSKNKKYVEAI